MSELAIINSRFLDWGRRTLTNTAHRRLLVYASKRFALIENFRKSIRTLLKLGKREFAGRASLIASVVLLAALFCAVSAFPQAVASIDRGDRMGEDAMRQTREKQTFVAPTFNGF